MHKHQDRMVRKYRDFSISRKRISKHFYSENVYYETSSDGGADQYLQLDQEMESVTASRVANTVHNPIALYLYHKFQVSVSASSHHCPFPFRLETHPPNTVVESRPV